MQARAGDGVATGRGPAAGCWARRREDAMRDRLWPSQRWRRPKHGTAPQRAREASRTLLAAPVTGFAFLMPLHLAQPAQPSSPPPPHQPPPSSLFIPPGLFSRLPFALRVLGPFVLFPSARPSPFCIAALLHVVIGKSTSRFSHRRLRRPHHHSPSRRARRASRRSSLRRPPSVAPSPCGAAAPAARPR